MNKINNNVKYNRPKISYNSTFEEIKEKNIENKRNLGYTESKIKYQVMNDKLNHQAKKKRKISNYDSNDNDGSFSFNQNKNKINNNKKENIREKNTNKNYVINFDKHLNPQKPIEIQKRYELNRFNNNNLNNIGINQIGFLNNNNLNNEDILKDFNEENIFNNLNNSNSNNYIDDSNNHYQNNIGDQLNNYKLEMLNFPKYEYNRGFNNNK